MERTLYSLGVPMSFLSRLGLSAGRDVMVRVGFCGSFLLRIRVVLVASTSLGDERVLFSCASCGCLLDRFGAMATAVSVGGCVIWFLGFRFGRLLGCRSVCAGNVLKPSGSLIWFALNSARSWSQLSS